MTDHAEPIDEDQYCLCDRLTLCDMHRRIGLEAIARIRGTKAEHQQLEESA